MEDVLKTIIVNGGLSLNAGLALGCVLGRTHFNEDYLRNLSDTPVQVGSLDHAASVCESFAEKNTK